MNWCEVEQVWDRTIADLEAMGIASSARANQLAAAFRVVSKYASGVSCSASVVGRRLRPRSLRV